MQQDPCWRPAWGYIVNLQISQGYSENLPLGGRELLNVSTTYTSLPYLFGFFLTEKEFPSLGTLPPDPINLSVFSVLPLLLVQRYYYPTDMIIYKTPSHLHVFFWFGLMQDLLQTKLVLNSLCPQGWPLSPAHPATTSQVQDFRHAPLSLACT